MRNPRLHGYLSFAGSLLETAAKSLRLSCGSELHADSLFRAAQTIPSSDRSDAGVLWRSWISLGLSEEHHRSHTRSRARQSLRGHEDFPRYYPRTFRKIREGFTDMSRRCTSELLHSGASSGLPDKEFRYLRTVHVLLLIAEGRDWLPALHVAVQFGLSHGRVHRPPAYSL